MTDASALVHQHLPMVRTVAQRFSRRLPPSVDMDDLVQAGSIGLMQAASRYDNTSPVPFEAYAHMRILGSMRDSLRRGAWRSLTAEPLSEADTISCADVEQATQRREVSSHVQIAVCQLPPQMRRLILLLVYEGLTERSAARAMGLPQQRVLAIRTSALHKLRKTLGHLRPVS